ncbi:MAG: thioredoxin [Candidatus Altiarchaeota archaeon]|nr:thioredoxin [Candidatus Altiarchaeota archaeon]
MVQEINDDEFEGFIKKNRLALVDFWAPWCGPCRMIAPTLEELAGDYKQVAFAKMNVDENQTPSRFGVMSIPNLIIFKGGEQVDSIIGSVPKSRIVERLEKLL